MLKDGDVRSLFALKRRGWAIKAIARELELAPNTVRSWLRRGEEAPPPVMGRRPVLKDLLPWVRGRFQDGSGLFADGGHGDTCEDLLVEPGEPEPVGGDVIDVAEEGRHEFSRLAFLIIGEI
jgi:hypothetical protein